MNQYSCCHLFEFGQKYNIETYINLREENKIEYGYVST